MLNPDLYVPKDLEKYREGVKDDAIVLPRFREARNYLSSNEERRVVNLDWFNQEATVLECLETHYRLPFELWVLFGNHAEPGVYQIAVLVSWWAEQLQQGTIDDLGAELNYLDCHVDDMEDLSLLLSKYAYENPDHFLDPEKMFFLNYLRDSKAKGDNYTTPWYRLYGSIFQFESEYFA